MSSTIVSGSSGPDSSTWRSARGTSSRVMLTAHMKGSCVVAVFTQEIAESKAQRATEMARGEGYPLLFTTEPEE